MINDDQELAIWQQQLAIVERIIEGWQKKLLPHNPKNFAIYAEGALNEAEKLRGGINDYLERRKIPVAEATQAVANRPPTNVP